MYANDCVAMILAGGRGERLGALTRYYSKPASFFGGNNRIIDFTLNNCRHSGIGIVGILSQYFAADLHDYVSAFYHDKRENTQVYVLPSQGAGNLYLSTADAVYKNIGFIDRFQPGHVLVLAGDHIYRMDYNKLIAFHKETGADVTVAATRVPIKEACRFGILNADADGRVCDFEEKPQRPKNSLASMGIYVFRWDALKRHLFTDSKNINSHHDFGKDIIPAMLSANDLTYTYEFSGYWRDVGTVDSLWEANMDQLTDLPDFRLQNGEPGPMNTAPGFLSSGSEADRSIISGNCTIFGKVKHSVLADSIIVGRGAQVVDSVVMPGAYIGENAKVYKAIVGAGAKIMNNVEIGTDEGTDAFIDSKICCRGISLVAPWAVIPADMKFQKNSHIYKEQLQVWEDALRTAAKPDYCPGYPAAAGRCGA
jgi:glucose-1-phosphate adenylyltransferase